MLIHSAQRPAVVRGAEATGRSSRSSTVLQHHARPNRRLPAHTAASLFAGAVVVIVLMGWRMREESLLTAESGLGYGLGIAGGTMMLLMLSYSARKRLRWMRGWGRIKLWFQAHMLLGVLGPVAILFHANFGLGSTNSNVALFSMLLVMASGIVGRFLYVRITHELYGQRANLRELRQQLEVTRERLEDSFSFDPAIRARLAALEAAVRTPADDWRARITWLGSLPFRARRMRAAVLRDVALRTDDPIAHQETVRAACERIDSYVSAVLKEAQFAFYERLFSLWHALHLPMFALLVAAGIAHVIAVHMY